MDYDAIVVGTGFGGTIAAAQLSRAGKKVLMLERGTWWITPETLGKPPATTKPPLAKWAKDNNHPVQYWPRPDHKDGLIDVFSSIRRRGNKRGLYQYSIFKQAHILTASAVGGGSTIYSNVNLKPPTAVLEQLEGAGLRLRNPDYFEKAKQWMAEYRGQLSKIVTKIPLPSDKSPDSLGSDDDYLYLDRSRALRDAAASIRRFSTDGDVKWEPLELSVIEYGEDKNSDSSRSHTFCERQGRCILGCLPGARHTLNKTLYAKFLTEPQAGVTLWPLAEVREVKRVEGGYAVSFLDHRDNGREKTVSAPLLFMGGGVLGTVEILLRSRDNGGLPLSDALGTRFSTNGDFAAFVLDTKNSVFSTRGPINTCHVQVNYDGVHINIEDCAIPAMFASVVKTALQTMDNFLQRELFRAKMLLSWEQRLYPDFSDLFQLISDTSNPTRRQTEHEMVQNIFFFNVMAQDDASGRFSLQRDELDLDWARPIADQPVFEKIETLLKAMAEEGMGGRYVPFPLWKGLANRKLVITHPLGGCPIGVTSRDGVVNEFGQVFDGSRPSGSRDVLPGLYIVDGSVIPGALSVNPTVTIAAQALKTITHALAEMEAVPKGVRTAAIDVSGGGGLEYVEGL